MKQPYHTRMEEESDELSVRLDNLHTFISESPTFKELDVEDQTMLRDQYEYMDCYLAVLDTRIAKLDNKVREERLAQVRGENDES